MKWGRNTDRLDKCSITLYSVSCVEQWFLRVLMYGVWLGALLRKVGEVFVFSLMVIAAVQRQFSGHCVNWP